MRTPNLSVSRFRRASAIMATLLAGVVSTQSALAQSNACLNLHASAQRELKAGHPKLAAEQFMQCGSDDACPEAVRSDCVNRYTATEKLVPSVVFSVVDQQGADVTGVQVFSGEQLLTQDLDGRALSLEPGKYNFRFVLPWGEQATSDVVLREAEKNRVVTVKVDRPGLETPAGETGEAGVSVSTADVDAPKGPPPTSFWIASGIGVAALGSFGAFAIMGRSKHEKLADCSPDCPPARQDDYDAMKRDYLIADISLGVAAVSAGVATWLFFSRDSKSESPPTAQRSRPLTINSAKLSIVPVQRGAGASLMLSGTSF